jgi:16S rRNA (cytidine1402-2'-O)-methyltransferase
MTGKLYLIPTSLGDSAPLETIPISIKKIIESIDVYIVENEKSARRFIKAVSSGKSQSSLTLFTLNKFTDPLEIPLYLEECYKGNNIGLLSDAGCPAVADPGAEVVKIAHEKNIKTIPLVGPSSILLAMMSSGMNGQNFAFNGYLPIDENQSQLFIETPYRNNSVLEDLYKTLNPDTKICVACDLTLPTEYIKTQTAKQWKHSKLDFHKRPAIFIIHKY